ncbi:MAG: ribonuclease III [Microbacteriaceae bacterium]|nr:ribonuclease III [Microbacteriaceae bacterium]
MTNPIENGSSAAELSAALGISVPENLLDLALTHRSFAFENGGVPHNERLEFLGDAILGQTVTVMLYNEFPDLAEGELAKRRASLVSAVALSEVARTIDLGKYLKLGKGEEQTGGRNKSSILADCMEAVIGAVFLAGGQEAAGDFVLRVLQPLIDNPDRFGAAMDPKTSLQEVTTEHGLGLPRYEVSESGPDHSKKFEARVIVAGEELARGKGTSKKQAETDAALKAWSALQKKLKSKPES